MSDSDDIDGNVRLKSSSLSPSPETSSLKRKREAPAQEISKRTKKRKRTKKPKDISNDDLDEELGVNKAIGHMDSGLLADLVAQRTKRFEPNLSLVELEDKYISGRICLRTRYLGYISTN